MRLDERNEHEQRCTDMHDIRGLSLRRDGTEKRVRRHIKIIDERDSIVTNNCKRYTFN